MRQYVHRVPERELHEAARMKTKIEMNTWEVKRFQEYRMYTEECCMSTRKASLKERP